MCDPKHSKAAKVLYWALAPLAVLDIGVLVNSLLTPFWFWEVALFELFYMIPALVLWVLLIALADRPRSLRFTQLTWGGHVIFNLASALFWIGGAVMVPSGRLWALFPLLVIIPVLICASYYLKQTFDFILPRNFNP